MTGGMCGRGAGDVWRGFGGIMRVVRLRRLNRPVLLGALFASAIVCFGAAVLPERGDARERRFLLNDRFEFEVGFLHEPPYEGEPNGLFLRVIDYQAPTPTPTPDDGVTPTPDPNATEAPEPTPGPVTEFRAEVIHGNQTKPLNLVQDPDDPTIYRSEFVPTQPGDYTFRIFGTLDGVEFSEEFRSSPNTFPGVIPTGNMQFPAQVPAGQGLLDALAEAEERTERARTFGVVGIALGVLGLLAGGISVVLARRPPPPGVAGASAAPDETTNPADEVLRGDEQSGDMHHRHPGDHAAEGRRCSE